MCRWGARRALLVAGMSMHLVWTSPVHGAEIAVAGSASHVGSRVRVPVKSLHELREEGVVLQELDFSCGAAALATILRGELDVEVEEAEIISMILATGDIGKIVARRGFSLLDLRRFVRSRGLDATGYRLDLESLADHAPPLIVPVRVNGFQHYVVLLGFRDGRALLADPAKGRVNVPLKQFARWWRAAQGCRGYDCRGLAFRVFDPRRPPEPVLTALDATEQAPPGHVLRRLGRPAGPFVPLVAGEF
ncbi:MAG: C39 family peptidase [Acidobacteriota bacterium]